MGIGTGNTEHTDVTRNSYGIAQLTFIFVILNAVKNLMLYVDLDKYFQVLLAGLRSFALLRMT